MSSLLLKEHLAWAESNRSAAPEERHDKQANKVKRKRMKAKGKHRKRNQGHEDMEETQEKRTKAHRYYLKRMRHEEEDSKIMREALDVLMQ